ncbi:zinc finger, mynd-type domain containing protein [Sporothrix brasiliensis 5110]|uniref:Zinc finger, mynd-type domain containing protein n=1 Tax=Sporothrix brasiliensis 5110 TaxID=1398154 RepID=A0A0C2IP40_9PEZI|nr:zinc finger, mynd-type domain containing protein [Sporothrix brasiliensis 5110]KIH86847.1 zinc finger, mynd-type domain containing protein [Sporothrix brasiliensis 5110]
MPVPDLADRSLFPPFLELPEDGKPSNTESAAVTLLAQVKDNMTITKPTLVLTDRDGTGFALVFDGLERDGLDLAKLGLKKGATAVVQGARQTVPVQSGDAASLTAKAARRPFLRVAPGQAHTVRAVPAPLDQTVAVASKMRAWQERAQQEGHQHCEACGAAGAAGAATQGKTLLKCTGCSQAWYCDRTCQTKGWNSGHKSECKALKALSAIWSE